MALSTRTAAPNHGQETKRAEQTIAAAPSFFLPPPVSMLPVIIVASSPSAAAAHDSLMNLRRNCPIQGAIILLSMLCSISTSPTVRLSHPDRGGHVARHFFSKDCCESV
ncbi:hypothetical protein BS78_05G193100 [Paspalum vaginatum]|nr:hypothetical protein BS78_05G193100 [Paspalum vaginatum]